MFFGAHPALASRSADFLVAPPRFSTVRIEVEKMPSAGKDFIDGVKGVPDRARRLTAQVSGIDRVNGLAYPLPQFTFDHLCVS